MPELRVTLEEYAPPREAGMDPNAGLAVSLKQLYKQLDGSVEAVMPAAFVTVRMPCCCRHGRSSPASCHSRSRPAPQTLRTQFPQFAEKGSRGHYKQQVRCPRARARASRQWRHSPLLPRDAGCG